MEIKIRRIDKTLPLPKYETLGAVAFDFVARRETIIPPRKIGYAPLNVCIATPQGHMLLLAARSSLHKKGLMLANGIGVGDQDFSGNEDEYHAVLFNFSDNTVVVERGERVVQGMFKPIAKCSWLEVDDLTNESRGGFGPTGSF